MLSRQGSGFFSLKTAIRYIGSRSHSPATSSSSRPFDRDQNEDGFMIVGKGTEPSALRPNLASHSSTTSDENWARILDDVDPPSPQLLHATRALRPNTFMSPSHRKYTATELELRAMENLFEHVFDMGASGYPQAHSLGAGRTSFLSNSSVFPARRSGEYNESDHELQFDEKREEMFGCKSDQELLQWAMREVFLQPSTGIAPSSSTSLSKAIPKDSPTRSKGLHPEIYGRMVASLMREFREQYNNPHLAIAIFDYTRRLSIISYVTGCTAPSYNELMHTHWSSFRNLQAVVNVAEEMRVNGVLPDYATAPLLNQIHDEVESRVVWTAERDDAEVGRLLERLDELLRPPRYEPITSQNRRRGEGGGLNKGRGVLDQLLGGVSNLRPGELGSIRLSN